MHTIISPIQSNVSLSSSDVTPNESFRQPNYECWNQGDAMKLEIFVPGVSAAGVEIEARRARTKDGAGGGPAEEQSWARGRGAGLLKIGESRTRMRGRDDVFE